MAVAADEDVLGLKIAVDDACGVQALDTLDDLGSVESRAVAPKPTPARELGREVASRVEVLNAGRGDGWDQDGIKCYSGTVWARTITRKRFSLSWKLHQSLTTNGSEFSAAMRLSTACSVKVCWSS